MEQVLQMAPMMIIAGVIVAGLAQIPMTNRGYGCVADMALGLAGSVGAGALIAAGVSGEAGAIVMFWVGVVGAIVVIGAQRRLWGAAAVRV